VSENKPQPRFEARRIRLGSRVGRRIFLLFFVCAVLPLLVSFGLAAGVVERQLELREEERLHLLVKDLAMNVYERFTILADYLVLAGERGPDATPRLFQMAPLGEGDGPTDDHPISGLLAVFRATGDDLEPILGDVPPFGAPGDLELWSDPARPFVLVPRITSSNTTRLFLGFVATGATTESGAATVLWGEIDPQWLWWGSVGERTLPEPLELVVLDGSGRVVDTTLTAGDPSQWRIPLEPFDGGRVVVEGQEYLGKAWRLPIHALSSSPRLQFVLLEPSAAVAAPYAAFLRGFALSGALALLLIVLLSLIEIRRTLVPLQELGRAAQRLAAGDLRVGVDVKSRDEFQDVASAFNQMALRLHRQFGALKTRGEIDRAILSSLEPSRILEIALGSAGSLVETSAVAIALAGAGRSPATVHFLRPDQEGLQTFEIPADELREVSTPHSVPVHGALPRWAEPLRVGAPRSLLVAPIAGKRWGLLAAASPRHSVDTGASVEVLASLAEQLSVALSNAALVEQLEVLQGSTLLVFARTVDLKSAWTSGHSERVAGWARELAIEMQLDQATVELIYRAGLVHDIGKIGMPDSILDKPSGLDAEETEIMRSHVRLGVDLLSHVPGYEAVVEIVAHHHEWWNGQGYPYGVAGEALHPLARLLAIADVFDALTSARPYRPAMGVAEAAEVLRGLSGSHLAPEVVEPFLRVVARKARRSEDPECPDDRRDTGIRDTSDSVRESAGARSS
jgi:putative nucleotidyltransferase with HDIG domain